MARPFIRLSSVTYAIRAQKLLERYGIRSVVKKQTGSLQAEGCGYGVEVYGDARQAAELIHNAGIRVFDILYI